MYCAAYKPCVFLCVRKHDPQRVKVLASWGFFAPIWACMEDRHKHYQVGILAHVDAGKTTLTREPAICQRSHFRTGERRKVADNEDGHHAADAVAWITIQAVVTSPVAQM